MRTRRLTQAISSSQHASYSTHHPSQTDQVNCLPWDNTDTSVCHRKPQNDQGLMRGRKAIHFQSRCKSSFGRTGNYGKCLWALKDVIIMALLTALWKRNTRNQYIKNYCFEFDFGRPWGRCEVTMTAVLGHLTKTEFGPEYKNWYHPPPDTLFSAPILTCVDDVRSPCTCISPVAY